MALLGAGVNQEPKEFAKAIALTAGWVALLILLADETHNAWADLYSSAVSLQNAFPKVKQRWLILGLGILTYVIAIALDITQYQNFLYLIGSLFVPLFGILLADYFVLRRRRYRVDEFFDTQGAYWYARGVNLWGIVAWIIGILAYHVTNPTTLGTLVADWPRIIPGALSAFGGSLPSFLAAFVVYAVLGLIFLKRSDS
jgi:NCS1 family nucleobase:cation symporter-1